MASLAEAERGNEQAAREYAERGISIVDRHGLAVLPQAAFGFTALAASQQAAGKTADALVTLDHGLMLRRKNAALSPWPTIHHYRVFADVLIDAGQLERARSMLDEGDLLLEPFDEGADVMRQRFARVRARLRVASETDQSTELTERELEVLGLLEGPQSLSEIARELYLSPNTVKTHTRAIYRKLGATSRPEAVRIARGRQLV